MAKIKRSYGIICCKKHEKYGLQLVLVKKPTTYHFCEFISGHYRKNDDTHLKKLFNNMTYHEKMDILSLKFNIMWYRIYKTTIDQVFMHGTNNFHYKQYTRKKTKFDTSFLHDGGARLRRLMADTVNAETLWEVPKGRRQEQSSEENISAAMREFTEETLITDDKYVILWHIKPYIETYSDFGVTYQNIYYYADAIGEWTPMMKFSDGQQISEVSAIRWCSLLDVQNMKLEKNTHRRLVKMFEKMFKKYKGKNKMLN